MVAVEEHLQKKEIEAFEAELENVARQKLTINKGVPSGVGQAFSLALNYCHLAEPQSLKQKPTETYGKQKYS